MRIFLSSCYLAALIWGVTAFTNPTTTVHKITRSSSSSSATTDDASTTKLFASYDYVSTRPSSGGNSDGNGRKLNRRRRKVNKDVVIVGGGLAGLSAALYLSQIDPNRQITILDKHDLFDKNGKTAVATFAAAGMLAPQSERLPAGDYLDLCMASKQMYPEFTDLVECMAQEAGEEGKPYLNHGSDNNLAPWNIGYVASGGFLAPAFAGDTVATWAPPEGGNAMWLDANQVRELEPNLNPDVVGGWWFPEDASVDARRLAASLRAACVGAGVQLMSGPNYEVSSLDLENGRCNGLWLKNGKYIQTNTCLVANGAWMRQLLPVPMEPHKGQSLSLRMPKDRPPILRRVLFASDSYIVPKADGRIIIGATVEAGSYDPNVTPAGILHILSYALQLVPQLADLPLEETWAGLRPTTPDKGPILGKTPWEGLFLAGGYWRNGVLLAPKTGELMAMLIAGEQLSEQDEKFLEAFAWDRFTSKEGGAKMAANARFAAAMYPVHSRKSGAGVAAAVGTELGSYSTAVSAVEERRKDREALFGGDSSLDALERAAAAGKADGAVFKFDKTWPKSSPDTAAEKAVEKAAEKAVEEPKKEQEKAPAPTSAKKEIQDVMANLEVQVEKSQGTFDGYQAILEAAANDDDIRKTMRENRRKNRMLDEDNNAGYLSKLDQMMSEKAVAAPTASAPSIEQVPSNEGSSSAEDETPVPSDLSSVYQQIKDRKAAVQFEMNDPPADERPDPGFRIYHIGEDGVHREVPPYTSPGEFLASIEKEVAAASSNGSSTSEAVNGSASEVVNGKAPESPEAPSVEASSKSPSLGGFLNSIEGGNDLGIFVEKVSNKSKNKSPSTTSAKKEIQDVMANLEVQVEKSQGTFDGYQAILEAAANDDDIRKTMRENRRKNRMLDEDNNAGYLSKLDQMMSEKAVAAPTASAPSIEKVPSNEGSSSAPVPSDLSSVYQQIKDRKAAVQFEMNDPPADERPDPGFRIYHIGEDGVHREVPPYTSPGEFLASIEKEVAAASSNGSSTSEAVNVLASEVVNENVPEESAPGEAATAETNLNSLDGYEVIVGANGSPNREDELAAMREARRKNRMDGSN